MCVLNKQFKLLEFLFNSIHVDLKYYEISLNFTAGSLCLRVVCSHVVVIYLSVMLFLVPYVVGAMVALTVMRVRLSVLDVSMLRVRGWRQCWCGRRGRCGCGEYWA